MAAVTAVALLAASSAQAFWQYRGHISDAKRSTTQLVVHHLDGKPRSVELGMSGLLKLTCKNGAVLHAHARESDPPARIDRHHRFVAFGIKIGFSVVHHRNLRLRVIASKLAGRVGREHAQGMLRAVTVSRNGIRCDTGRLLWHAQFVPRSSALH